MVAGSNLPAHGLRQRGWRLVVPWLWAAWLAAWVLFGVDRLRAWASGGELAPSTLQVAWTLWAGHQTAAGVLLLVGIVALGVAHAAGWTLRARPRLRALAKQPWLPALLAAGLTIVPAHAVGVAVTDGAWISQQWFAPLVRAIPVAGMALGVLLVARVAFTDPAWPRSSRRWWSLTAALLLAAVTAELADHRVFPGLHPKFHLAAYSGAMLCTLVGIRRLLARLPAPPRRLPLLATTVLVAVSVGLAPVGWSQAPANVRASLILESAIAANSIRELGSHRKVPVLRGLLAELDVHAGELGTTGERDSTLEVPPDWNVLVVVVDTLRADALVPARPEDGKEFAQPGDTPFLDRWLEQSYRFEHAYAACSMTHRSMPSMFYSAEAYEDLDALGPPLARRMEDVGRHPFALVIAYFLQAKYKGARVMLEGFRDVKVYEKNQADSLVHWAEQMMDSQEGKPFFGWVHFYNMHDPGFAGKMLHRGSRKKRYRQSLRWLDRQMKALMDALERLGIADETIVVLASDHGEGLGDNRQLLHGPTVFEEEIRVPLAIRIPGQPGAVISETVGNIDLVPTLMELLGGRRHPRDRGRSLVPSLVDDPGRKPAYYVENSNGQTLGVVQGRQKLIYDREAQAFYRFDLTEDPEEEDNLFDPDAEIDRHLLRALVQYRPGLFKDELDDPQVRRLLLQRLGQIDPQAPGAAAGFLVRLVALRPFPKAMKAATELFRETSSPDLRATLMVHLWPKKRRHWADLSWQFIAADGNRADEIAFVQQLAFAGQARFANRRLARHLRSVAERYEAPLWTAWLRLVSRWKLPMGRFGPPLARMLKGVHAQAKVPTELLELLLDSVAALRPAKAKPRGRLVEGVRPLLDHEDSRVQVAAVRALAALQAREAAELFDAGMRNAALDHRVRRAMLLGLVELQGADAVPALVKLGNDPGLTSTVVRTLGSLGNEQALPFLRKMAEKHYNGFVRRDARRAIKRIRKQGQKRKSG